MKLLFIIACLFLMGWLSKSEFKDMQDDEIMSAYFEGDNFQDDVNDHYQILNVNDSTVCLYDGDTFAHFKTYK